MKIHRPVFTVPSRCCLPLLLPMAVLVLQSCSSSGSGNDSVVDPGTGGAGEDTEQMADAVTYPDDFLQGFENPLAEGFDGDSLYVHTFSFAESTGSSGAAMEEEGIILRARSDGSGYANRYASFSTMPETAVLTAAFDERTSLSPGTDSSASVSINAVLFRTSADTGLEGNRSPDGNVSLFYSVSINAAGQSVALMCLDIYGETGYEPYVFGEEGAHCWQAPSSLNLTEGEEFRFGYDLDRAGRSLLVHFNDQDEMIIDLPHELHEVPGERIGVQAIQEGGEGESVVRLTRFQLDDELYELAADNVVLDRLAIAQDSGSGPVEPLQADGQLRFELASPDGNYREGSVQPLHPSDYLEAVLTLSGITLGERGRVQARLENTMYNALPLDARDGRTGDVQASVELIARHDGTREALVCLVESLDREFDDRQGLLGGGDRRCETLPMNVSVDTPYRVAIALIRSTSTVIFRVNGQVFSEEIGSEINAASEPSARIILSVDDGASVVISVDNIRTSPTALTASELSEGLLSPPRFPAPEEPRVAESDVSPVYDHGQRLDFVDDFSTDSMTLAFNSNVERGYAGIGYSEGALELRTASHQESTDNSSYSEVYLGGNTRRIKAKVSLSSETDLPSDPDSSAQMRLQGTLFRDNQDYPLNDTTGDIYTSIEINVRGDGRRRVQFYVSRRVQGADDERLAILDGDNGGHFEDIVPELDTSYELGIELDAGRNMLVFSVDDKVREFQLPWQAYTAARNDAIVQVSHQGTSGRAVGRVYQVETDSVLEAFSEPLPLIGPYRPLFAARFHSQEVRISDGRLHLSSDARIPDSQPARVIARGVSDHVGADLKLSSQSVVSADADVQGRISARVGGLMYRAALVDNPQGDTGSVFALASLVATDDGELFAEYCAFQSLDSEFDNAVELLGGDENACPRFATSIQWDTYYPLSVAYHKDSATLEFRLGSESMFYAIAVDTIPLAEGYQGAQARASGASMAVVHIDNLAFSAAPVALAESTLRLLKSDAR
ncbi:hypothetical protein ACUNV4_08315 [Granulosicoccus sp. 3-233]|uniref:hypothetical protein n=1 Tax=Granulosicoccus sp. 3-233 TaxID=3417969 RepID=UPI003D3392F8